MSKLRVNAFTLSLDGYGAGPDQDLENPLGVGGKALHKWAFTHPHLPQDVRPGRRRHRRRRGFRGAQLRECRRLDPGAQHVRPDPRRMAGRNWKGWWGDNPPYHVPVFVLTHHARAPIVMEGGTTFYFVTEGIHSALEQAKAAAERQGCAGWRRRRDDPAISAGEADRRDASGDLACAARHAARTFSQASTCRSSATSAANRWRRRTPCMW